MVTKHFIFLMACSACLVSCDFAKKIENKAAMINRYEKAALTLTKENRNLHASIAQLEFKIKTLESENEFVKLQLKDRGGKGREIASIAPAIAANDLVRQHVYNWSPKELYVMAQDSFKKNDFEKANQLYSTFLATYPTHEYVNDAFYFQAGLAAYEAGSDSKWILENMKTLMDKYPTSKYYRGAKLWSALTELKMGNDKKFFSTVEEFRKKYRNTPEWKILSAHYEKILIKYKN